MSQRLARLGDRLLEAVVPKGRASAMACFPNEFRCNGPHGQYCTCCVFAGTKYCYDCRPACRWCC